jgi:hypothetical protein
MRELGDLLCMVRVGRLKKIYTVPIHTDDRSTVSIKGGF